MARQRDSYRDVGAAMRCTIQRATERKLTAYELRVLLAVLAVTASWSLLRDAADITAVAAIAFGTPTPKPWQVRKTREPLAKLDALKLVTRDAPPSGWGARGKRWTIGLHAPCSGCIDGPRHDPRYEPCSGSISDPAQVTHEPASGSRMDPAQGEGTRTHEDSARTSRESSAAPSPVETGAARLLTQRRSSNGSDLSAELEGLVSVLTVDEYGGESLVVTIAVELLSREPSRFAWPSQAIKVVRSKASDLELANASAVARARREGTRPCLGCFGGWTLTDDGTLTRCFCSQGEAPWAPFDVSTVPRLPVPDDLPPDRQLLPDGTVLHCRCEAHSGVHEHMPPVVAKAPVAPAGAGAGVEGRRGCDCASRDHCEKFGDGSVCPLYAPEET